MFSTYLATLRLRQANIEEHSDESNLLLLGVMCQLEGWWGAETDVLLENDSSSVCHP